jgi:signal transduction histidine kinase
MGLTNAVARKKSELNISLCLTGVIPMLVVVYLLSRKISTFQVFTGQIGYIMLFTIIIFMLGMFVGRRLLLDMLAELIEKSRLAAVTETVLTLGHEINNPLLAAKGNLELIETEQLSVDLKKRLDTVKSGLDRISEATEKLKKISRPESGSIFENIRMLDLEKSK